MKQLESNNKLTICPTPIGNLEDVSLRLLKVLKEADIIYSEDTRVTSKLLNKYNIKTKLKRLDQNFTDKQIDKILEQPGNIAYCTDAGTPSVSDPGAKLVSKAKNIEVLPGPCAALTAYVHSGFEGTDFYFGGFFPRKNADKIKEINCIQIYYESPHRINKTLDAISKILPNRQIAICRELTKIHEEIAKGTASELKDKIFKGEIVIVIDKISKEEKELIYKQNLEKAKKFDTSKIDKKGAINVLRQMYRISKNDAYKIVTK